MKYLKSLFGLVTLLFMSHSILFAQNEPIKVACIGNSITYGGMGASSYPQRLGTLLGSKYLSDNFGVSGTTMLKNGDMPYWEENTFYDALDFNADIIIVLLGTNDSKPQNWAYGDEFYDDYMDFLQILREGEKDPVIFVGYPLPVFKTLAGINEPVVHDEIIPIIDSVITSANTLSIDFYELMKDHSTLVPDGVHPNAEGYNMMAEFARDAILNMPSGQVITFRTGDKSAEENQSVFLKWNTSANSTVTLNGESVNQNDSTSVVISEETTYELIAEGDYTDTSHITISFIPPGVIKTFYAEPSLIEIGVGDTAYLNWDASNESVVYLDGTEVNTDGIVAVSPETTTTYTLIAEGDVKDTSYVTVQVLEADKLNRAYNKTVTSSSTARGYDPVSIVDGNPETYWVSENSVSAWVSIDLGKDIDINRVKIDWGDNFAKLYHLQLMAEDGSISTLYSNTAGDGGVDDLTELEGKGRYLRVLGISKNSNDSGYVINEVEVYGTSELTDAEISSGGLPDQFELGQNYPNPFNPVTTIEFSVPSAEAEFHNGAASSAIKLIVYDILGREISTPAKGYMKPGTYKVQFDGTDLPSGIYFYELRAGSYSDVRKMILLK